VPAAVRDALLRQSGVIRAESLEELFDTAALLSTQPVPKGSRVAVLGNAGGPGVLCADVLESNGLILPALSRALQSALKATLPAEAAVHNPVDLIGTIDPELYRASLRVLLKSDEVDAVIVIHVPRERGTTGAIVRAIRETACAALTERPILGVFMELDTLPEDEQWPGAPIPSFLFPEAAARALAHASWLGRWRRRPQSERRHFPDTVSASGQEIRAAALKRARSQGGWLDIEDVQRVLTSCGFSVPRWLLASSAEQAVDAARQWGTRVVLKVVAASALHKTEVGGVRVDLSGAQQIRAAFEQVAQAASDVRGVLVQEFVPGGHEVLVGVNRDPVFGPLIGCGLGGVLVELGGDVAFRLHPLTESDAADLVDRGALQRVLAGHRGRMPGDRAALIDTLLRVSALIEAFPEIAELDLNPVMVLPASQGVRIVDARIRVLEATT
jgi:acyl-CoA synthetase (NDP forming)